MEPLSLLPTGAGQDRPRVVPLPTPWAPAGRVTRCALWFRFPDDRMAPAFPKGTVVTLDVVRDPARQLVPGAVYVQFYMAPGPGHPLQCTGVGRLAALDIPAGFSAHHARLHLTRDCDGLPAQWQEPRFGWPHFYTYRVTYYVSLGLDVVLN